MMQRIKEPEFRILQTVLARKVSTIHPRGPQYQKPQWVRGTIIQLDLLHQRALIAGDGSEFWASLGSLQKI